MDYTPISLIANASVYARLNEDKLTVVRQNSDHHPPEERRAAIVRSRKIAGQLAAIECMLGDDRDCAEILMQIVSARRGLKSLAEKLIHSHARHCIERAQNPNEGKRKLRDLLAVLERYVE